MADPNQVNKTFSIMGSSFIGGAQQYIERLRANQPLTLKREPDNPKHSNAIAIFWGNHKLGWVPRQLADEIAPYMDADVTVICRKAPPMPRFGAFKGILELAYIPPKVPEPPVPTHAGRAPPLGEPDTDEAQAARVADVEDVLQQKEAPYDYGFD